ncbi:MAG: hypothetical protein ACI86M_002209 [Saprospiraceae bacterium]|jgi:hypothetical protein
MSDISNKLNTHYQYLITLPQNNDIKDLILPALQEISNNSQETILEEMLTMLAKGFKIYQGDLDNKLKRLYDDLKKSDSILTRHSNVLLMTVKKVIKNMH